MGFVIHIIRFAFADESARPFLKVIMATSPHNHLSSSPAEANNLPTILSSLLLTLIIRVLHTITKLINILSTIIILILHTLTKLINILLAIIVIRLNVILSTLALILYTANLIANPASSTAEAATNVRGNVFGVGYGVVETLFSATSHVFGGVFDGLGVVAEGVADGLFFVVEGLVGAVVAALCR